MHELSICQALVRQVEALARRRGASGVASVRLRVGPLSGVEPRLLEQAYPLAAAGTAAEHAALVIEVQAVRVRCGRCGAESDVAPNRLLCGTCGDWHTQLVGGDALLLESVELVIDGAEPCATPAAAA